MPFSLTPAPAQKLAYFRKDLPECEVYHLILWETVDPNSAASHSLHTHIDQKTPMTPEGHAQFIALLNLTPCDTLPEASAHLSLLPCPGLHSTWSVNTIESLSLWRNSIFSIKLIAHSLVRTLIAWS